jgi:hypothetical protein
VRLKQLEAENAQMKRIIARKELELDAVRELIKKTVGALSAQRGGGGARRPRVLPTKCSGMAAK